MENIRATIHNNIRATIHNNICRQLNETYKAKNADYGNSFKAVRDKYPNAILIRLNDKLNRLESLMSGQVQNVNDESIEDTLIDLANYAIMELVERRIDGTKYIKELIDSE